MYYEVQNFKKVSSMSTKYHARVIDVAEIDEIISFEQSNLVRDVEDEQIRMFLSWSAPWRKESLEFYLPKGWCFAVRDDARMVGYFLAQPVLFFRQMTQTLWVEYLNFENREIGEFLLDLAFKTAREKHIQSVFISPSDELVPLLQLKNAKQVNDTFYEFQATKIHK